MSNFDIDIHCNHLQCRKDIGQQKACVTSCSHIFCVDCANERFSEAKVCPACGTSLTQKNDIILIQLSPSEEYKSSILAGLKPDVIIDICSRALAFYNYQISQELYYRISVQQLMEQKLDEQHDTIQHAARDYHRSLKVERDKAQNLANAFEKEKRRSYDLQFEIQNKTNQFAKLQQMYEKLKRKAMGSAIQQSVQETRSSSIKPPQALDSRFDTHSYYQPFTAPKAATYNPSTRRTPSVVVDPTRQDTFRHPQKTLVPPRQSRKQDMSIAGTSSPSHHHHHRLHQQASHRYPSHTSETSRHPRHLI